MPLRDHFHPPLSDLRLWEGVYGAWPGTIAVRLNTTLPTEYRAGPRVRVGPLHEDWSPTPDYVIGGSAAEWALPSPTLLLESETPVPPEYEVRVYNERSGRRLVAAVEIVSPGNKDRPESREAFVSKCHSLLQKDVCVTIVDPVTERAANLYGDLADLLGADPPRIAAAATYAVTCRVRRRRGRWRGEAWEHELAVGAPLPTLPLWLNEDDYVPLELEATYEDTCRGLRIG